MLTNKELISSKKIKWNIFNFKSKFCAEKNVKNATAKNCEAHVVKPIIVYEVVHIRTFLLNGTKDKNKIGIKISIIFMSLLLLLLQFTICIFLKREKQKENKNLWNDDLMLCLCLFFMNIYICMCKSVFSKLKGCGT